MNSRVSLATESRRALVIVLRGLGPAFIGGYGNEWIRTPTLDRLCARGVTFDRHYATQTDVGLASQLIFSRRDEFLSALKRAGVKTVHVRAECAPSSPASEVDEVVDADGTRPWSLLPIRRKLYPVLDKFSTDTSALVWIEADPFAHPWHPLKKWLKYYFVPDDEDDEPLTPWVGQLPERVAKDDDRTFERLQSTFAANVSAMDRSLGKLLAGCRSRGFGQNAMIIVTSDLGFPLGEHGPVGRRGGEIQESLVHLPLIIRLPGGAMAEHRMDALTQPADVGVTLAEFFSLPGEQPNSLLPLIHGDATARRDHLIIHGDQAKAIRTVDRMLVRDAGSSLVYEQPSDRWLVHDVASTMPDEHARLESLLSLEAN